jgi:hypothetical protein
LREVKTDIERRGAKLWVIGNGAPHFAQSFAEETRLEGSVFTDPERALYRALGFKRGLSHTVNPKTARNAVRALFAGHRQTAILGDRYQQGGAAVVSKGGELEYVYVSKNAGDHSPIDEVLQAIPADRA